ncbi:hypothetical protein LguiA_011032 [Lonicera macranthoides]
MNTFMDYYKFLGVIEIIKGSIKILSKNGKLMASIATLGLLLNSFSFLLYAFFFKPLRSSMNAKTINLASKSLSDSESTNLLHSIKKDAWILIGVQLACLLVYALVCLFINISTIYTSAMSLYGHDLSLKKLFRWVIKSFKRVYITSFRIKNRTIVWFIPFYAVLMIITFILIFFDCPDVIKSIFIAIFIAFSIIGSVFILHASVVWVLAFVIAVVEEDCYGIEALTKAKELVKGRRVDGFVLNFMFNLFLLIIFKVYEIIATKWPSKDIVIGLFLICIAYLVIMFFFSAYTFLYFKCKESHGEEIELGGKLENSNVPTTPLLNEDIP